MLPKFKKLNENEKEYCEGMISQAEWVKAIKSMQNGKPPGTDGLPVEFYKIIGKNINKMVMIRFHIVITLLPPKNNDIRFLIKTGDLYLY